MWKLFSTFVSLLTSNPQVVGLKPFRSNSNFIVLIDIIKLFVHFDQLIFKILFVIFIHRNQSGIYRKAKFVVLPLSVSECDFFWSQPMSLKWNWRKSFYQKICIEWGRAGARLGDSLGTVFQAQKEDTHKWVALNSLIDCIEWRAVGDLNWPNLGYNR